MYTQQDIDVAEIAHKFRTERGLPEHKIIEAVEEHGLVFPNQLFNLLLNLDKQKSRMASKFKREIF